MAFPPRQAPVPPQFAQGAEQLKQALAERLGRGRQQAQMSARARGGPPGPPDEATESPQEKARERKLGIP